MNDDSPKKADYLHATIRGVALGIIFSVASFFISGFLFTNIDKAIQLLDEHRLIVLLAICGIGLISNFLAREVRVKFDLPQQHPKAEAVFVICCMMVIFIYLFVIISWLSA